MKVCSFGPIQALYEASCRLMCVNRTQGVTDEEYLEAEASFEIALDRLERAAEESKDLTAIREWARSTYIDSDCDIDVDDDHFTHHNGNGGYWVGAWLWVSEEDFLEEGESDT